MDASHYASLAHQYRLTDDDDENEGSGFDVIGRDWSTSRFQMDSLGYKHKIRKPLHHRISAISNRA